MRIADGALGSGKPPRSIQDHNWQTFFDHFAPQYLQEGFTQGTAAEVDFLWQHLALAPGSRVLDLGCGTGRHAVALAKRGAVVTGVDISSGMLSEAQCAAAQAGVAVEWVHSRAEDFRRPAAFTAAYSVCEGALSLLGLADAPDRDLTILANLWASLLPGGILCTTVLNGMRMLRHYQPADVVAGRFSPLGLVEEGTMEVQTPRGPLPVRTRERGYVPSELGLMLRHVGFEVLAISGGTAGNWRLTPPDLDEMEILALARKVAP